MAAQAVENLSLLSAMLAEEAGDPRASEALRMVRHPSPGGRNKQKTRAPSPPARPTTRPPARPPAKPNRVCRGEEIARYFRLPSPASLSL